MADTSPEQALAFWQRVAAGVAAGERHLLAAESLDGRLDGTVSLVTDMPPNQPHRGDIAKMLVHRRGRRQGLASALLEAAHSLARSQGLSLLVLDTVTGSDASRVYERAGWQRAGDIPGYALFPNGELCSTTYYFKPLAQ
jgi:GNAT superfamily N-acetyltransferase